MKVPDSGTQDALAGLQEGWGDSMTILQTISNFIKKTFVIVELELKKLRHDPSELITRAIQPTLWLMVFGQVFTRTRAIPTGDIPYIDFMAPGILCQSVLFISIFFGITIIWERDLGIVHKFLVSPAPREAFVLGKALSAGFRGLSQAVIIFLLSLLMGVGVSWSPINIFGVLFAILVGSALFSTLSLIIACLVKTRERLMGIGQLITMPLFFASNAIYPIQMMPQWLRYIAWGNPLTYLVDATRSLMLVKYQSQFGIGLDFVILLSVLVIFIIVAGRLYPKVVN